MKEICLTYKVSETAHLLRDSIENCWENDEWNSTYKIHHVIAVY